MVALVIVQIIGAIFISQTPVHAEEVDLWERTGYTYTGINPETGAETEHQNFPVSKVDNTVVFCVEPEVFTTSGLDYQSEMFVHSKKDILSKIVYYGYTSTEQSNYDYAVTQVMVWEELGDQYVSSTIADYHERKAVILDQVAKYDLVPSWNNQSFKIDAGQSLILEDTNNILSSMNLVDNSSNLPITISDNQITIAPTKDT